MPSTPCSSGTPRLPPRPRTGLRADSGAITPLVWHRFATVRMADLIVYLEDGHAAESGTHDALMASGGRYAELFTLQAAGYT